METEHASWLDWRRLVAAQLAAGKLERVLTHAVMPAESYRLLIRERLDHDPRARAFRDWIMAKAESDLAVERPSSPT